MNASISVGRRRAPLVVLSMLLGSGALASLDVAPVNAAAPPAPSVLDDAKVHSDPLSLSSQGPAIGISAGFSLAGVVTSLEGSIVESPYVALSVHQRWPGVDFGAFAGYLGSGRVPVPSGARARSGEQILFGLRLRWRFVDASWGALFVGTELGVMFAESTARAQNQLDEGLELEPVIDSEWLVLALVGGSVGALASLTDDVSVVVAFRPLLGIGSRAGRGQLPQTYGVTALVTSIGVEVGL